MKIKFLNLGLIFCILSAVLVGLYINSEKFAVAKAEYYYRKNDVANAAKYYEKAFERGYKNSEARNNYVKLLINSPLTTETQEKIINFVENKSLNDSATYNAEKFITNLRKEINKKYHDNYISRAVYNQKVMHWSHKPITYGFLNPDTPPAYFRQEIEAAFDTWQAETKGTIKFKRNDTNPDIRIRFNPYNPSGGTTSKYIIAYTTPVLKDDKLKNMAIEVYTKDPDGILYSKNQVYNTALHEIGHALGFMGHSANRYDVLYLTSDLYEIINDKRSKLTMSDINTMQLLYEIKPEITDNSKGEWSYLPYIVLGSEKDVADVKIAEAKTYIKNAPYLPSGYMDLAEGYVAANEYEKASKSLLKALRISGAPEIKNMIYYNLAIVYYLQKDYKQAEFYVTESNAIRETEENHHLLAEIYRDKGAKKEAIKEYDYLIEKYPQNIDYAIEYINIFVKDKKYVSARKILKRYIKNNPEQKDNSRLNSYGILKLGL